MKEPGTCFFSGIAGIVSLGVRIVTSYLFAKEFGNMVIAYVEAFSWVVLLVIYIIRFYIKKRKSQSINLKNEADSV